MPDVVNLDAAFARIHEHWSPHVAGDINDMQVKLVKVKGVFDWHHHEREDELFFVHRGSLTMRFRDRDVVINPGEFLIVPHGVEHCPVADEECEMLLFEPGTTLNTGNIATARTKTELKRL